MLVMSVALQQSALVEILARPLASSKRPDCGVNVPREQTGADDNPAWPDADWGATT